MNEIVIPKPAPLSEVVAGRQVQMQYINANISQETDMKVNFNFRSSKEISVATFLNGCRPRKSNAATPNNFQFPGVLVNNFKEINKKVTEWLSASNDNVHLYLNDPVSALTKAGVDLSREDQKALSRSFENVKTNFLAAPGTNIKSFTAAINTNDISITKNNDCGCK